jgi:hypothetical protein
MNYEGTFWLGVGVTMTLPMTYGSNVPDGAVAPYLLSLDVPLLFDIKDSQWSILIKPSLLGAMVFETFDADTLMGYGFSISAGPVYYFDERKNFGIAAQIGYKYLTSSNTCTDGTVETYNGGSIFGSIFLTIELASDNIISD